MRKSYSAQTPMHHMAQDDTEVEHVKSDETLLTILEGIKAEGDSTITDLATYAEVSNSTVHRHLTTLKKNGYVVREGTEYNLGFKFLDIGEYTRHHREDLRRVRSIVKQLADDTGEVASFMVEGLW
jgi:DNA-binding IclR family transcriptional regulator